MTSTGVLALGAIRFAPPTRLSRIIALVLAALPLPSLRAVAPFALVLVAACAPDPASSAADAGVDGRVAVDPCDALFGAPNASTGLDDTQCRPTCGCDGAAPFVPRAWDAESVSALRAMTQLEAPAELTSDPYAAPAGAPPPAGTVCAVRFSTTETGTYTVETHPSIDAAAASGAIATHAGACGVCSSLTDLAVYAGTPDLTAPVRQCALEHVGDPPGLLACIEALGFTRPCAQIWTYNTEHTRAACGAVCVRLLSAPYHLPDGSLNECLACDEAESGDVFKSIAGRTRRNSGLANSMCRPCSEVIRLTHAYPGI